MTTISFSKNGNTPFEKLIGYNPEILSYWNRLEEILWGGHIQDRNMLEQIRRAMAFENGCEYCMVKAGRPDFDVSQMKISIAVAFAELFCKDHKSILPAHFDMLREYFTDHEISGLCVFISFVNASQKLGKIFNLSENDQPDAAIKL
ncbi:carboxymuconolactone decarboxylase family protein [uncultured Chryseobacterium sp.]|uniref:carboxymuconolactone decarboxylase family protein n=1 Tax=uncultured Chryseobacterium sp. TaxID=259322 RepID=UPI0025D49BBF|nr:carboxymuconolactone decarboxylase family protein [uncultured Chryseobacterium sp.]